MLARMLQFTILSVCAISLTWFFVFWERSPGLALGVFLGSLLLYVPFLGLQFLFLHRINLNDPAQPASWGALFRACWQEILQVPRAFFWRQAFFWNAIPDTDADSLDYRGQLGVVFIHGFICNRGLWTPWLDRLSKRRRAFIAVNLEPVFGSIDEYAPLIDAAVSRVTQITHRPPLIVCHSMGGLAVRAWLRSGSGTDARVHHIVTIGTPHQGTWLGRMAFTANGRQMRLDSRWLRQLQTDESLARYSLFTCYYSNCDNIVFPASTATLQGADNRFVPGAAHVAMAFDQTVMSESLARI